MKICLPVCFLLFPLVTIPAMAQKPFSEGMIVYKVRMLSAGQREVSGTYSFIFKGAEVRKEIRLDNGYQDILLLNCSRHTVYSLQNHAGHKYAVELSMTEMEKKQEKYRGFSLKNEERVAEKMAGFPVQKGAVSYPDGSSSDIYYTSEWRPAQTLTFEQFPDAQFMPMEFSYTYDNGMVMRFEVEKMIQSPIENAVFRIPGDYRMISYAEYKQMSK